MKHGIFTTAMLLLVAACAHQPAEVATRLDPRTADFSTLRVFMTLPPGHSPAPGFPVLRLESRVTGAPAKAASARLVPVGDPRGAAYGIVPADLAALADVAGSIDTATAPGQASIRIDLETCLNGPAGTGPVNIAVAAPSDPVPLALVDAENAGILRLGSNPNAGRPCP